MTRTENSSLTNALRILKSFSIDQTELTLDEIATMNNISKSTACRLVHTYHLGLSALYLSNVMLDRFEILKKMTSYLKKLTELTGESSHIAVLQGNKVLYLKKEDNQHQVQLRSHIGRRNPAHCTASGLALLAFLDEDEIRALYKDGFEQPTKYSIASVELLLQRLEEGRKKGYFVSEREMVENVLAVGAPIFHKDGTVFASVSVAGLYNRMKPQLPKIVHLVKDTSEQITAFIQQSKEPFNYETFIG